MSFEDRFLIKFSAYGMLLFLHLNVLCVGYGVKIWIEQWCLNMFLMYCFCFLAFVFKGYSK